MRERTPKEISERILELCEEIAPGSGPVFIEIAPEPGCEPADCFENVRRKIKKEGGRIQYGWALWEWPGVFIEAEHHAVYEPPSGTPWHDLTPCLRNSSRRLFLADDKATYNFSDEGIRRDNIRRALADDSLIEEFFKAARKRSAFYNGLPGMAITLHASEDKEMQKLERRVARAVEALTEKYGTQ